MAEKKDDTKLKKFFKDNRTLVFTIPVFIVLVIVAVLMFVFNGNDKVSEITPSETNPIVTDQPAASTPAPTAPGGTEVTTLPQNERDKDSEEISRNPFADPFRVSGIIYDKSGSSIAIIEAENKSFIVKTGEEVSGYFKVINIEENKVVLEVEGNELVLSLSSY